VNLREARAAYFAAKGFHEDGGHSSTCVPLMFGWVRLYLYAAPSRRRAAPIHDLHHVLTGYATTPAGEAEVAASELGAGAWSYHFATFINLAALLHGTVLWPGRTCRAVDAWVFGAFLGGALVVTLAPLGLIAWIMEAVVG